jgi:hypothetical protein
MGALDVVGKVIPHTDGIIPLSQWASALCAHRATKSVGRLRGVGRHSGGRHTSHKAIHVPTRPYKNKKHDQITIFFGAFPRTYEKRCNREPCLEPWTGGTVRSKTVKLGLPQWRTGRILEKMSKPYNALLARRAGVISSGGGIESAGVT